MLVGVVGKTNVGKSSFFKALTLANVEIANHPFTTIKPNHGVAHVKVECADRDFALRCNPKEGFCVNGIRFVPFEVLDVAGLVPGAHLGKGLGLSFLDDLRQADALIHVIDASGGTDENGEFVAVGSYDPVNDIMLLEKEIDMWYTQILKSGWEKFSKIVHLEQKEGYKEIAKQFSGLKITENDVLETMKKLNLDNDIIKWSEQGLERFAAELRMRTKPMIIAANKADVSTSEENIKRLVKEFPEHMIVACSAESEIALKEASKHALISYTPGDSDFQILEKDRLSEKQLNALKFIKENVLKKYGSTGVQEVINSAVFNLLKCIAVFPVATNKLTDSKGNVLPDCFLVPQGVTAHEFAYKVHTDLGERFVKAVDLRTKLIVGKEHRLKHRDVVQIITS